MLYQLCAMADEEKLFYVLNMTTLLQSIHSEAWCETGSGTGPLAGMLHDIDHANNYGRNEQKKTDTIFTLLLFAS